MAHEDLDIIIKEYKDNGKEIKKDAEKAEALFRDFYEKWSGIKSSTDKIQYLLKSADMFNGRLFLYSLEQQLSEKTDAQTERAAVLAEHKDLLGDCLREKKLQNSDNKKLKLGLHVLAEIFNKGSEYWSFTLPVVNILTPQIKKSKTVDEIFKKAFIMNLSGDLQLPDLQGDLNIMSETAKAFMERLAELAGGQNGKKIGKEQEVTVVKQWINETMTRWYPKDLPAVSETEKPAEKPETEEPVVAKEMQTEPSVQPEAVKTETVPEEETEEAELLLDESLVEDWEAEYQKLKKQLNKAMKRNTELADKNAQVEKESKRLNLLCDSQTERIAEQEKALTANKTELDDLKHLLDYYKEQKASLEMEVKQAQLHLEKTEKELREQKDFTRMVQRAQQAELDGKFSDVVEKIRKTYRTKKGFENLEMNVEIGNIMRKELFAVFDLFEKAGIQIRDK